MNIQNSSFFAIILALSLGSTAFGMDQNKIEQINNQAYQFKKQSVKKEIPTSVKLVVGGGVTLVATAIGYILYRIGKYVHAIKQQKSRATMKVSAHIVPDIANTR